MPTAAGAAGAALTGATNDAGAGAEEDGAPPQQQQHRFAPLAQDLNLELKEGGEEIDREMKEKQRALIDALPLDRYEIEDGGAEWEEAEKQVSKAMKGGKGGSGIGGSGGNGEIGEAEVTVSVKSKKKNGGKRKGESAEEVYAKEIGEREAKRLRKGMRRMKG